MVRRQLLKGFHRVIGLLGSASSLPLQAQSVRPKLKILMRSSWGSEDPTRAAFPFAHALALADAGHDVRIFLTAEATNLMRRATSAALVPIGWPPLDELRLKVIEKQIPVFS